MTTDFTEVMAQRSDKQLAEILTLHRNDYQPSAIEAAELEFKKRGLETSTFITEEEIKKSEEIKQPVDPAKENLHWYFKILTLGLPSLVWVICQKIFADSPPLIYSFVPIAIIIQFLIHHFLQEKGFNKIASDFKDWCYYSWIIRIAFFLLGYLVGTFGH
ncbi:MAG: hypothetical protein K8R85_09700 [Bacteroidetes bacterium]|nr:hypothetical protein [Bacteroidota bacterium]